MIALGFTPEFLRRLKKLEPRLRETAFKKIELFRHRSNHERLAVHKLHGKYVGFFSFSIDRRYRVIFERVSDGEAILHTIGDHSIYD